VLNQFYHLKDNYFNLKIEKIVDQVKNVCTGIKEMTHVK
jgi:hypothetical protein